MKAKEILLAVFLLGIAIFSVFLYGSSLRERYTLVATLEKMEAQMQTLENEKSDLQSSLEKEKEIHNALADENRGLKDSLKENNERVAALEAELREASRVASELNGQIAALKAENASLTEKKEKLALELVQVSFEKDQINARLSSLSELKKAIKELRTKMRHAHVAMNKLEQTDRAVIAGNRGYLLKDGKLTSRPRIRIEVEPVSRKKSE